MVTENQRIKARGLVRRRLGMEIERLSDDVLCDELAKELLSESTPQIHRVVLYLPFVVSDIAEGLSTRDSRQRRIARCEAQAKKNQDEVLRLFQDERVVSNMPLTNTIVAELTVDDLKLVTENAPSVQRIETDKTILPELNISMAAIGADARVRQSFGLTGKGIVVAVVGGKVDSEHPAFAGQPTLKSSHFPGNGRVRFPRNYGYSGNSTTHETLIAGIIAGAKTSSHDGAEFIGVAPDAEIWSYPLELSSNTPGYLKAQAVLDACADGADIINCSWRVAESTPRDGSCLWCRAVSRAVQLGAVVVKSAGNGGPAEQTTTCPAHAHGVISVGALSNDGTRMGRDNVGREFSSRGPSGNGVPKPEVVAPGENINGPAPGGSFTTDIYSDGTSFAAPHVSGMAALILERYPNLKESPLVVREALLKSAVDLGLPENAQGKGRVDFPRAIEQIEKGETAPLEGPLHSELHIEVHGCVPRFAIHIESRQYFAVELASDYRLFNMPLHDQQVRAFGVPGVTEPNLFATWFEAPPLLRRTDEPTIWSIPTVVWQAFERNDKLYFRVLGSTAADAWEDVTYSTDNDRLEDAPWIEPHACSQQGGSHVFGVDFGGEKHLRRVAGIERFDPLIRTGRLKRFRNNWNTRVGRLGPPATRTSTDVKLVDGVFEGGGTLGLAYTGYLTALADQNVWFRRAIGTSAGSIQAAAIAMGFSSLELEYLTLSGAIDLERPDSLPAGVEPIDFSAFLDLPSVADVRSIREETAVWNLLRDVLDPVFSQTLPIPDRGTVLENIVSSLSGNSLVPSGRIPFYPGGKTFEELYEELVSPVLGFLPGTDVELRDIVPLTNHTRDSLAEEMWDLLAEADAFRALVAILYKGGLFKGDAFLEKMRELAWLKLGDPDATFSHPMLQAELAVIAANISDSEMLVYSRATTPNLEIAEAVRRSMSVPMFFYPRVADDKEIVDGGLYDNYPYLLYSDAAVEAGWMQLPIRTGYVPIGDTEVAIFGARLDDETAAPADWGGAAPKWIDNHDNPYKPSIYQGLLGGNIGMADVFAGNDTFSIELLGRLLNVYRAYANDDQRREQILKDAVLHGRRFDEARIPLKGYFWLDFDCNGEQNSALGMCDRGWQSAMEMLEAAGMVSSFSRSESPYR